MICGERSDSEVLLTARLQRNLSLLACTTEAILVGFLQQILELSLRCRNAFASTSHHIVLPADQHSMVVRLVHEQFATTFESHCLMVIAACHPFSHFLLSHHPSLPPAPLPKFQKPSSM
jgi:hypothetical protein